MVRIVAIVTAGLWIACGPVLQAPKGPGGSTPSISAAVTTETENLGPVAECIGKQLGDTLQDAGYVVLPTDGDGVVTPSPDRYRLAVTVVDHDPGSPEARAVVGFGAGACTLATRYRLTGHTGVIVEDRTEARSGRACRHAITETIETIARRMGRAIAGQQP